MSTSTGTDDGRPTIYAGFRGARRELHGFAPGSTRAADTRLIQVGMAEIAGFRGILYDTRRVESSNVLAPPYDVIDAPGRAALAAKGPHNCIQLIAPSGEGDGKYENAKRTLAAWLKEGVLGRDLKPAIYRYHQVFASAELGGQSVTRRGFIAAVRLHEFAERIILPHERTLKGPKIDRLKLWGATQSHLSQIFTLYSDPAGEADRAFAAAEAQKPVIDGTTEDGTRHRVWRVDDTEVIATVKRLMAPLKLYIADGHHRYETMLALRRLIRDAAGGELESMSAANFGMLFLANMDDSGLIVLPTHRLVHSVSGFDRAAMLESLAAWFDVATAPGVGSDVARLRTKLAEASKVRPSIAAIFPGDDDAVVLTLRADFDPASAEIEGEPAVQRLDVTLLHQLVLERVLKIDRAAQEAQTNLAYIKDTQKAIDRIAAGEGQVCFVMNATPVEQVCAVADGRRCNAAEVDLLLPQDRQRPRVQSGPRRRETRLIRRVSPQRLSPWRFDARCA